MKRRTTKKKLELKPETVRNMTQKLSDQALKQVAGGGSLVDCQTRLDDGE